MLGLRMAGGCLFAGLLFMYGLNLWLPAVLFFCVGACWSAYAYDQLREMEEDE